MERLLDVVAVLSLSLMVLVLSAVRREHIRVEYSVSWLAAAALLFVLSRSRAVLERLALLLGVPNPPIALLLVVFGVFVFVFYRLSIQISQLKDANTALVQRLAILETRLPSHETPRL